MHPRTPAEVDHLFGECANAGDLEGMIDLYEPAATFVLADGGLLVGHEAIREYFAPWIVTKPTMNMGTVKVVPLGDDLALLHHDWRATFTGADGEAAEMSGKATEIVRRQGDGSWRFVLDDPDMRG